MDLPPFVKRDKPIIVIVHVLEEFGQAAIRDCEPRAAKSCLQLLFVQLPIAIFINRSEELIQLTIGAINKCMKLYRDALLSETIRSKMKKSCATGEGDTNLRTGFSRLHWYQPQPESSSASGLHFSVLHGGSHFSFLYPDTETFGVGGRAPYDDQSCGSPLEEP